MRYAITVLIAVTFLAVLGCASPEPLGKQQGVSENISAFNTGRHEIDIEFAESALGNPGRVYFQVWTRCEGSGCIPQTVTLSFSLASGSNTVYLTERSLLIRADGKRYHWVRRRWLDVEKSSPVVGNIITVRLDLKALETIAKAETVTGLLASQPFTWSYENRKPLRALLDKMKS